MLDSFLLFTSFQNNELVPQHSSKAAHTFLKYCYECMGSTDPPCFNALQRLFYRYIHLWMRLFCLWPAGAFACWLPCVLNLLSQTIGLLGVARCYRLNSNHSHPRLESANFSQMLWFLSGRKVFGDYRMNARE